MVIPEQTPVWGQVSDEEGKGTTLTLTYEEIETQLSDENIAEGEELSGYWTTRAETEETDRTSTEVHELTLIRGEITDAEEEEEIPNEFTLYQNYPNPFNPVTQIRYKVPEASDVTLRVYDVIGQHVSTLVNEQQSAGNYEVSFDATELPSGTYIYPLEAGEFVEARQMMLIK